jgi:hypothetical protein
MELLVDFTAGTILEKFQNDNAAQAVERVLKKLSTEKAAEILAASRHTTFSDYPLNSAFQTRESRLPSFTFISAYFAAFRSSQRYLLSPRLIVADLITLKDIFRSYQCLRQLVITPSSSPWKPSPPPTMPTR